MRVTGSAISRDCGSGSVLGHDERAAVGGVAAVLGLRRCNVEDQVAGLGARGDRHRFRVGRNAEVREADRGGSEEHEGDDPPGREGAMAVLALLSRCQVQPVMRRVLSRARPGREGPGADQSV